MCKKKILDYLKTCCPIISISILSLGISSYLLSCNAEYIQVFDDSYISLKFAENFFRYGGITYDGTTFLTGATSPLHILFIVFAGLFVRMEAAPLVVGIVFFWLSSIMVYLFALKITADKKAAILAGLMMATNGWMIFDSLNGLETTTFIFFSLVTFYLFYSFRNRVFYVIPLVLSILIRPEGWFAGCAIGVWLTIQYVKQGNRQIVRFMLKSLGLFALMITPYLILCFYCTGSLLPGTALAKAAFFAEGVISLPDRSTYFRNCLSMFYTTLIYPVPVLMLPLIFFARRTLSIPYLMYYYIIFYLAYFLFFPGAIAHYWCRYQHIFIPLIIIAISDGVMDVVKRCRAWNLKASLAGLIAVSIIFNQVITVRGSCLLYASSIAYTRDSLIDMALWLKDNTPEDCLIAVHDIGAVGYFSNRRILDLVGLVNPEVTRYYMDIRRKKFPHISQRRVIDYLRIKQPDYLVMFCDWDRYFNFFKPDNSKYFKLVFTSNPIPPCNASYSVFKCNWEP